MTDEERRLSVARRPWNPVRTNLDDTYADLRRARQNVPAETDSMTPEQKDDRNRVVGELAELTERVLQLRHTIEGE